MKYCYYCGRSTAGDPLFCATCGRSFDKRICPRLHVNARSAGACSRCGSTDLSTPHPQVPLRYQLLEWLTRIAVGAFLVFVSALFAAAMLADLAGHHTPPHRRILFAVLLATLWWGWSEVPHWFRTFVRRGPQEPKRTRRERVPTPHIRRLR